MIEHIKEYVVTILKNKNTMHYDEYKYNYNSWFQFFCNYVFYDYIQDVNCDCTIEDFEYVVGELLNEEQMEFIYRSNR